MNVDVTGKSIDLLKSRIQGQTCGHNAERNRAELKVLHR